MNKLISQTTRCDFKCFGMVSSSCSTSDTCRQCIAIRATCLPADLFQSADTVFIMIYTVAEEIADLVLNRYYLTWNNTHSIEDIVHTVSFTTITVLNLNNRVFFMVTHNAIPSGGVPMWMISMLPLWNPLAHWDRSAGRQVAPIYS